MKPLQHILTHHLIKLLLFFMGWLFIVASAAHGAPYQSIIAGALVILFHLITSSKWLKDLVLIVIVALFGWAAETLFIQLGFLQYTPSNPFFSFLAPFWVMSLYGLFATLMNHALNGLKRRPIPGMIAGAIGGSLAYFVSSQLNALDLFNPPLALLALGLGWLILLPLLFWIASKLDMGMGTL